MALTTASLLTALVAVAPLRVVVVPIANVDDSSGVKEIVGLVGTVVDEHYGLRATTIDELFSVEGTALSTAVERCGANHLCVQRQVRSYRADFGLIVVVNRNVTPALVELTFVDARPDTADRWSEIADLPDSSSEASVIHQATEVLLGRAGHRRAAKIKVSVEPADATVVLDAAVTPEPRKSNLFVVAAGPHVVELQKDGFEPQKHQKTLSAGEVWPVDVELVKDTTVLESPYFWTAVGVGAVAVTVVAVILLRPIRGVCLQSADGSVDC